MTRQRSSIPEPARERVAAVRSVETGDDDFPDLIHRVCNAEHPSPWYYSTRSGREELAGRFDLRLPRGACYWSDTVHGAFCEALFDPDDLEGLVPASDLKPLALWSLTSGLPSPLANTTLMPGGLPKELGAGPSYDQAWAWADALDHEGRAGVIAWARIAPDASKTVALFGDFGPAEANGSEGRVAAGGWAGYLEDRGVVAPDPSLGDLDVAE